MDRVSLLLDAYRERVDRPWRRDVSGPERVWIAVYPAEIERRIRVRRDEFGVITRDAGRNWRHIDLTRAFAEWLGQHEQRERYFRRPQFITPAYAAFADRVAESVRDALTAPDMTEDTVVALSGVGSLYPMLHVSELVGRVAPDIRGRMFILFPGSLEHGNYRLLDASDGWNYLAIPITIPEGGIQ
jgi:hypothetical protein